MKDNAPIGVFDSGIGGLTIVKELRRIMPSENIIYVGDTARVPYGSRDSAEILVFMRQILDFLKTQQVKMAVIACNTMTTYGYEKMLNQYPFMLVPMNSGVSSAIQNGFHKNIGVIATEGTVKNGMHAKSAQWIDVDVKIYAKACPEFVPLIERGKISGLEIENATKEYMEFFNDKEIDSLILGCTHYPLISKIVKKYLKAGVSLVNPAQATGQDVWRCLEKAGLLNKSLEAGALNVHFSSDLPKGLAMAKLVLETDCMKVEKVDFSLAVK